MPVAWTPEARERASPRRWPGEARDPRLDAAVCVREVREVARRWDEATERDLHLGERVKSLRLLLARCEDGAYAEARDAALPIAAGAPLGLRCALAYAFPHEGEWSADAARAALAASSPPPRCGLHALRSIADPDLATRLAIGLLPGHGWDVVMCAYDLVAAMGEQAAPVLLAIEERLVPSKVLRAATAAKMRSPVVTALALVRSEVVAQWLAAQLDRASTRRVAAKYFREAPELAGALRACAKKRSAAGKAAKTILAMATAPAEEEGSAGAEAAADSELPEVLRAPPWRSRARWPKGLVVKDDVAIALITGSAADRERWAPRIDWVPRHLLDSSAAAWAIVHAMFHRDGARDVAREWLLAMPEIAAAGVVPMAVGKDARRRAAGRVLRMLVAEGHGAAVQRGIEHYSSEEVRAAANAVLAIDPHFDVPATPPTMPAGLRVEALAPPRLRSGKPLPRDAVRALAEMLQITSDGFPYAGVDDVREACDPASLEAFSLALFEAWGATGAATKTPWPLQALAAFGGDAAARELGPRVRGWAQQQKNERAHDGLRVLEAIGARGSDVALVQLVTISDGARAPEIAKAAAAALDRIAALRGAAGAALDRESLADRLAPDLGLDEAGRRVLDYGPRRFVVTLDEHLDPVVTDESGHRTSSLPRPTKADDAALAAAANEAFRALKADADAAARTHIRRFEAALRSQRRWSRADFFEVLLPHRVLGQVARRLLWGAQSAGGERLASFRVVEDGTLADASDRAVELGAGATHVVLAHPLFFAPDEAARWGELFSSYEIMQPFAQIARETFAATEAELRSTSIARHDGATVPVARLFAMEHRGWARSHATYTLAIGEHRLAFDIEPGIMRSPPPQRIGPLRLWKGRREARFGELSAVAQSEVLRDLALLVQQ